MKPEEFESKMHSVDPARDLSKMSEAELHEIAVAAIAAEPSSAKSSNKYGKGLIAAAVAALIAVPALNGAMTADSPPIISLGSSANLESSLRAGESVSLSYDQKLASPDSYFWGAYRFELSPGVTVDSRTGLAYEMVARDDAAEIIAKLAAEMGLSGLEFDKANDVWQVNADDYSKPNLWASVSGSWASLYYNDPTLDPWADCYYSEDVVISEDGEDVSSSSEECTVSPAANLPSDAVAEAKAAELFEAIGLGVSNLTVDVSRDEQYVWVNFAGDDNAGQYYSITFVDNGEVQSLNASLTEQVELGNYDLLDAEAAIARANEQADRYIEQMEADGFYSPMVGESDSEPVADATPTDSDVVVGSDGDTATTEPSPAEEDVYVEPVFEVKTVIVTEIKLVWAMQYAEDGSALLLPTFEFYGYVDGEGNEVSEYPFHSVIAVVDEQIDLDSFYSMGYWSVMPMAYDLGVTR